MRRVLRWLPCVLLGGCPSAPTATGDGTGNPVASALRASPEVATTPGPAARAPVSSASAAPGKPASYQRSEKPSEEQWAASAPQTQPNPELAPANCDLRQIREWVRVSCKKDFFGQQGAVGLGTAGQDYFSFLGLGDGTFTIAARPGDDVAVRFDRRPPPILRIYWPIGAELPAEVSFLVDPLVRLDRPLQPATTSTIPQFSIGESPRPADAEWVDAPSVNTADAAVALRECEFKLVREWLRLRCNSSLGFRGMSGFGKLGVDYDQRSPFGGMASIIKRLSPGIEARAGVWLSEKPTGTIEVTWPKGAPKPTVISARSGL